ncbi:stage V sporulation protein B [Paenibacillus hemerocallicola]|uniref:Stage V sporulation protein B n=1 Tax=Paenibacillus hemerocallicola TaxID=1172614 RepID=A0A5C4T377_9BACL|nr:stage V sporulation protein B [Paenibacillus hemerocallicola]TNJ63481.1 stage V sporulation protein B [Paenibacillus hemerocallicola]
MQKQSFVRGTFILTAASLTTRILGFVSGIFLARSLGAEGIGLLMMAHPLVPLVITLTELGLPVAISKLVAEADVKGDKLKEKRILAVSLVITGTLSIILTLLALLGSKYIAALFLTDQRAYYAMLAITPIAPIVAISAVLKGYFRGKQHMMSIALSDVFEHIAHIACMLALVQLLLPYGIEYAAAGAMVGAVVGEGVGLLYLVTKYKWNGRNDGLRQKASEHLRHGNGKRTFAELMRMGLPTTGLGFVHSIYSAFQPMLITKSLALFGLGTAMATKQYGLLVGYAFPLLVFPSFITHSLSTALIPAVSEAMANRNGMDVHRRMDQAMRIALFVGAPATVILYIWATPLTTLLYNAPEAGPLLRLLAPVFFLHYFEAPLHAVLLGLGKAGTTMWNYIAMTIMKAAAIYFMGSQFGITGVVLGMNFGICFITLLNFFSISSLIGFYLDLRRFVKVALCMAAMAFAGQSAYSYAQHIGMQPLWSLLGSIGIALAAFLLSLVLTNTINGRNVLRFGGPGGIVTLRK